MINNINITTTITTTATNFNGLTTPKLPASSIKPTKPVLAPPAPTTTIMAPATKITTNINKKPAKIAQFNKKPQKMHPYLNPSVLGSLGSLKNYRKAHNTKTNVTQTNSEDDALLSRKTSRSQLEKLSAYTIHKQRQKHFDRNPVVVFDSHNQMQADLMDVHSISKLNKHKKFCLVAIDCFSKQASCVPIKNKCAVSVLEGFKQVFKELGVPDKLQLDQGMYGYFA